MKAIRETEKAVLVKIAINYYTVEKTVKYDCWIPKSQLTEDGVPTAWITERKKDDVIEYRFGGGTFSHFEDANGETFDCGTETKKDKFVDDLMNDLVKIQRRTFKRKSA